MGRRGWDASPVMRKQTAGGKLLYNAQGAPPGALDDLEWWAGGEGRRGAQEGGMYV